MAPGRRIVGALVAVLTSGLVVAGTFPAAATFPGDDGSIMYARWGRGFENYGFFTIEPDGSGITHVGIRGMEDASWSPDGATFAYAAYLAGGPKVFIVDASTGDRQVVVRGDDFPVEVEYIGDVAFGPTGDRLVLGVFARQGVYARLFTVDTDGTDLTQISGERTLSSPDWSSTDRIVAAGELDMRTTLFTLDADGTDVELLARLPRSENLRIGVGALPSWAPDGSAVAFTSQSERRRSDIWLVDADGSNLRRLTDTARRWEWNAVWGPSGDSIAVSRGGRGDADPADLWVYAIVGGRSRVTDTPRLDEAVATWRPA